MTEYRHELSAIESRLDRDIIERLRSTVGERNVSSEPETLYVYSACACSGDKSYPGAVALPGNADQVVEIVKLCQDRGVPLAACVSGEYLFGATDPPAGQGVLIDLKRMDRIVEVNEKNWYALLEPAVTFGRLSSYLEKNHPGFSFGYPYRPSSASVMAEALAGAVTDVSHARGDMSEWINGLEMVLPSGELARTGTAVVSSHWLRVPSSPLTSSTLSASNAICTRISLRLWPRRPSSEKRLALFYNLGEAVSVMRACSVAHEFDDVSLLSGLIVKGALAGQAAYEGNLDLCEDDPCCFLAVSASGRDGKDVKARLKVMYRILRRHRSPGAEIIKTSDLRSINPDFTAFADLPNGLRFIRAFSGKGMEYFNALGPVEKTTEALEAGIGVMKKHGIPALFASRLINGAHAAALDFFIADSRHEKKRGREVCSADLAEALLGLGFFPNGRNARSAGQPDHARASNMEPEDDT